MWGKSETLVRKCSICNSEHRTLIDGLLLRGVSGYKISEKLRRDYGVNISKSAIYRHRKNCVLLPRKDSIYQMLYETGNRRLARAIERTEKTIKTHRYCGCSNDIPRILRKKGLVWICSLCGGWIPYNLGLALKRRFRRSQRKQRIYIATSRSRR